MPDPGPDEEEAPDDMPEEPPTKSGNQWSKPTKRPYERPSLKTLEVVRMAQKAYCRTHKAIFKQEGLYDLTLVFWEMACDTTLLNSEIHEVQEVWTGWRGLNATIHAKQTSLRDILFSCLVLPNESPHIMGLKGVYFPEALHQ